jgi:Helicase conserved C-terminal domain
MIMNAATHPINSTHALIGTATPHKNDEAEVYSMASMLDPDRYGDRHEFMQSFGQDLSFNPDAIRRELGHRTMTAKVDPEGVDRIDLDNPMIEKGKPGLFGGGTPDRKVGHNGPLPLNSEHKALVDKVDAAYEAAKKARNKGAVDVESIKALSPKRFDGVPEAEHEKIATELLPNLGMIRDHALRRAINRAPPEINTKLQAMTAAIHHDLREGRWTDRKGVEHKGKPSIVFTDSAEEAKMIHEHLNKQGIRASLYHGGLSPQEKEKVRLGYQPEANSEEEREKKATSDVMVMTAAGEAGINLQRAKVIHHFDVPQTDKSHTQRSGRAYRQGQQGDVDVHNWHTDTKFEQDGLRRLRRKGDLGSVFQTPISNLDDTGVAMEYQKMLARKHEAAEIAA